MDRHFEVAPSATPPSAPAASPGYPTNGNPQTATPATEPGEWWFHMITESLRRVIVGAGLTPSHANLDLLKDSLVGAWRTATETLVGVLRVATQTETNAGTADDRAVTPKKLRWGVSYSLSTQGYIVFPSWLGGLIIQWGQVTTSGSADVTATFPVAFPTAALRLALSGVCVSGLNSPGYNTLTASNVKINSWSGASTRSVTQIDYIVVGY